KVELGAPYDDLVPMVDVMLDRILQRDGFRPAVHESDHVDAEGLLTLGVLEQLILHDERHGIALQLDDHAQAFPVALIAQVRDAFDPLLLDQVRDLFDEGALVDLIWDLGDHQCIATRANLLLPYPGTHHHTPTPRFVGLSHAFVTEDDAARREIRRRQVLHQSGDVDGRIVDVGDGRIDRLTQIVRWNLRSHTDGDAVGAIEQKIGDGGGENAGFLQRAVEVLLEVDGILVDVAEHFLRDLCHPRFRIPHGRGRIAVDGAEVALAVHERIAHGELLRHPDHRIVDRRIPVRMIFAEYLADDAGALFVGGTGREPEIAHPIQHPAMYRLQPVAHVRQRAADDHRHRIVDVGRFHLLLNIDRDYPGSLLFHSGIKCWLKEAISTPGGKGAFVTGCADLEAA